MRDILHVFAVMLLTISLGPAFLPPQILAASSPGNTAISGINFENRNEIQKVESWATGKQLDQLIQSRLSTSWHGGQLRNQLYSFSTANRIAIFLDRRIDPGTSVTISVKQVTVEQFLWKVAEATGIGVCRIGDVFYFGPTNTTDRLPILWQPLAKKVRRAPKSSITWPEGTRVTELQSRIVKQDGQRLRGPDKLPHDVWPAGTLPNMSGAEKIAIVAVGFDKWIDYQNAANGLRIVEFPNLVRGKIRIPLPTGRRVNRQDLAKRFADCELQMGKQFLIASGPVKSLAAIKTAFVHTSGEAPAAGSRARFSLKTSASRRQLLQVIANQLDFDLKLAGQIESDLDRQIEVACQDVSLTELIQTILADSSLEYEVRDSTLRIFAR